MICISRYIIAFYIYSTIGHYIDITEINDSTRYIFILLFKQSEYCELILIRWILIFIVFSSDSSNHKIWCTMCTKGMFGEKSRIRIQVSTNISLIKNSFIHIDETTVCNCIYRYMYMYTSYIYIKKNYSPLSATMEATPPYRKGRQSFIPLNI